MLKKLLLSLLLVGTLLYATPATQENLTKLYIATFDRAPDAKGLQYWLDSGWEIEAIAISFFDQEETEVKYPEGFSLPDFINAIYANLFARDADSDGFEYWLEALQKDEALRPLFILAVLNGALGDDAKILSNKTKVGLAFVKAGRNDIEQAHNVIAEVTHETPTVGVALCKYTLAGCPVAPTEEEEEEEEEEEYVPHPGGGGASGGGAVISPTNTAPTADAGADQTCAPLNTATALDGSASSDTDTGDTLTYAWSVTDEPIGSTATLTGETTVAPSLTFDTEGSYTISLIVNDGTIDSAIDIVTVQTGGMTGTIDGYGLVCSPHTGKVWLDRNLGATQVCTAFDDTACYGDYYQWGRDADGHEKGRDDTTTTSTQATDVANAGTEFITSSSTYDYDWAHAADESGVTRAVNWSATDGSSVCPTGYRVPTEAELTAETTDEDVTNSATAFASFLKLPSAGYRFNSSGSLDDQGSFGYLWSASVVGSDSRYLFFDSGVADWSYVGRAGGQAVRCLRD